MIPKFPFKQWMILLASTSALSMIFLDSTILPVALPTIQSQLGATTVQLQWMINAYFLANASTVLAGGKISDIFGHRRIFMIGLILFAVASAVGGLAESANFIILSRAFQGLGAGLMSPSTFSILTSTFSKEEQGRAVGTSVSISSIFLSIGPFLGGIITQFISWRAVFWLNIPVAIGGLYLALTYVPSFSPDSKKKLNILGMLCMIACLLAFTIGLMDGPDAGWLSKYTLSLFAISVLCGLFLWWNFVKSEQPFFDFGLFRYPYFLVGNILILLAQFLLIAPVFWAIYFQRVLGESPTVAGSWTVISTIPVFFMAFIAGHWMDKHGPRGITLFGGTLFVTSLVGFYFFLYTNSFPLLFISLVMFGTGVSSVMTPFAVVTLSNTPLSKRGLASGVYNTIRFTGATLGIAVLGSIHSGVKEKALSEFIQENPTLSMTQKKSVDKTFSGAKVSESSKESIKKLLPQIETEAEYAERIAMEVSTLVLIGVAIFALCLTFFAFRSYTGKKEES